MKIKNFVGVLIAILVLLLLLTISSFIIGFAVWPLILADISLLLTIYCLM